MTDELSKLAANLSPSEIMDKLTAMQEEMFMTGHNAGLKSVYPVLKSTSIALNKVAKDIESFLLANDKQFAEEYAQKETEQKESAEQFANRVAAGLEPNASIQN